MANMTCILFTPAEIQADAVQPDNDTAALLLVRRAIQLEATPSRAGDSGNMTGARNKMQQARTYRAAAGRLAPGAEGSAAVAGRSNLVGRGGVVGGEGGVEQD